jgi:hypothetical protein
MHYAHHILVADKPHQSEQCAESADPSSSKSQSFTERADLTSRILYQHANGAATLDMSMHTSENSSTHNNYKNYNGKILLLHCYKHCFLLIVMYIKHFMHC